MLHDPTFWVAIAFAIFVVLAFKPLKNAMMGGLDKKIASIKAEVDEAARLREEAQSLLAEYERKQAKGAKHAEEIVAAARKEAEESKTRAEAELQEALVRQEKASLLKIEQAEEKAIQEVRSMAVELAISAASKLITERVEGKEGDALIDKAIGELPNKLH